MNLLDVAAGKGPLARDPHEESNRAAEEPQRVSALRKQLDAWWAGRKSSP